MVEKRAHQKTALQQQKKRAIIFRLCHDPHLSGTTDLKAAGARKIFIAEKQETSYYRFCGYGNNENTHLFDR